MTEGDPRVDHEPDHKREVQEQFRLRSSTYSKYTVWSDDERVITEILRPLSTVRKDAMCLDVGGGAGLLAERGAAIAGRWTILDLSIEMLRMAKKSERVVGDAEALPFADKSFDFVCERSMLQYGDQERIFQEVRRVLREDGLFVVAEKVLGDYEGAAAEWYRKVQAIRNPLKGTVPTTASLAPGLRAAGFEPQSVLELRRTYVQNLSQWLSRSGTIPAQSRTELERLIAARPPEVRNLGLSVNDGKITVPLSWAVLCGRTASPRPQSALVVSLIPVRMSGDRLMIYVQERRTPVMSEPEYIGTLEFPQGHVELGETLEQAARRELTEEAGLSVRRVLGSTDFSEVRRLADHLVVENAVPSEVVITRGRLNFLSLAFVVEAAEWSGDAQGATDNRGRWVTEEEFVIMTEHEDRLYPLNAPMFKLLASRLMTIKRLFT